MFGRWSLLGATLAAMMVLVSCASGGPVAHGGDGAADRSTTGSSDDVPSRVAPTRRPASPPVAATCDTVPPSSGPLTHAATLAVSAPASASLGKPASVTTTMTARVAMQRVITAPAWSALLLVRDGRVVARTLGAKSPADIPVQLRAGATTPAQAVPRSIMPVPCRSGASGRLAAGRYDVVAVLGYRLDPLNAAPDATDLPPYARGQKFALVSAPAPIELR